MNLRLVATLSPLLYERFESVQEMLLACLLSVDVQESTSAVGDGDQWDTRNGDRLRWQWYQIICTAEKSCAMNNVPHTVAN